MSKKSKSPIIKPYPESKISVPRFSEEAGFYTTPLRSFNMSRIKGKNTKPEKLLKKALWHAGIRYKSNKQKLPGKPDISLIKFDTGSSLRLGPLPMNSDHNLYNLALRKPKIHHQIQQGLLDSEDREEYAKRPGDQSLLLIQRLDSA